MTERRTSTEEKVLSPATRFKKPDDIVKDGELSQREKREALNTWEQDARQLMTAINEGMAGAKEGLTLKDHHRLGEVLRAKDNIGDERSGPASSTLAAELECIVRRNPLGAIAGAVVVGALIGMMGRRDG
jgi:hypothetical protein